MTTIKKVAEHAGVSITTVSHVLNHPDRVSKDMRDRVLGSINALSYQPNPNAQSLRTGRTNLLALMIPDICNPFFPELVQIIQTEVGVSGLDTVIYNTDVPGGRSIIRSSEYFLQISPKRFDGVIIAGEAFVGNEAILRELKLPSVYIGHLDEAIIDNVSIDEFRASYQAVEYLIHKGHRRIAHISGELAFFPGRERLRGYQQALLDYGLPLESDLMYQGTFLRPSGREGIRYLLDRDNPPSAVFIASGMMAIAALATIKDMGRRAPDDVAVVTFDNIAEMEDVRPTLTTVDHNPRTIGQMTAQLLLQRLEGTAPPDPQSIKVPYTLLEGDSG